MADPTELKALIEQGNQTIDALRGKVDDLAKKHDGVTENEIVPLKKSVAEVMQKLQDTAAEHKARMDDLARKRDLPAPGGKAEDVEAKAFGTWLRKGDDRMPADEAKSMSTLVNPDGGYLVPVTMADGVRARLRRTSPIRSLASVVQASIYSELVERGDAGFEWAGETQTRSATATPTMVKIEINSAELSARASVSQRMLDEATLDVAGWLESRIAERFARGENAAFVTGDGVNSKPKGFTQYSTAATDDESRANQTLQHIVSGADGAFASSGPADVLTTAFYKLQPAYQANAAWVMKNDTAAAVATLKDGDGSYLLRSMLNADGTLLLSIHGRPLVLAHDMPAHTVTDALAIAFGDFAAGYTIVDNGRIALLRDPYSQKPMVEFYATKRVGGGVVDFDAIKFIKFSAS